MSRLTNPTAAMRERMERYRRLSRSVLDRETASALAELADELQVAINKLDKQRHELGNYVEEAENCRRQALAFQGRPEAQFLLSVARAFEDLAGKERPSSGRSNQPA